jgi:hypothetical protein
MAKSHSRKQGKRMKALLREQRMLQLKKTGAKLLSDRILQALQAAGLPAQKRAYEMKLRELLGE